MSETDKVLELSGLELPETVKPPQMPKNIYPAANSGAAAVKLSDCGCGCQKNTETQNSEVALNSNSDNSGSVNSGSRSGNIVYAIGTLGYEFRTESSKDSFQQAMNANPYDPTQLLRYLDENPEANEDVLWTLNLDATPIYVIFPFGGFAEAVYRKLRDFYREQLAGNASRISVPGTLVGSTRIISGQELPIIMPKGQGMFSWTTAALIEAVVGSAPEASDASALQDFTDKTEGLENFLDRVYYELRNLGITPKNVRLILPQPMPFKWTGFLKRLQAKVLNWIPLMLKRALSASLVLIAGMLSLFSLTLKEEPNRHDVFIAYNRRK
jgi:hypothetical protein